MELSTDCKAAARRRPELCAREGVRAGGAGSHCRSQQAASRTPVGSACSLGRATARDQGRSGSRSRNHGDGGGADGCGQLPAAGWEWFFPARPRAPSHRRADLKRQPAVLSSLPRESDNSQQNVSLKRQKEDSAMLFFLLREPLSTGALRTEIQTRKLILEEFSRSSY